MVMLPKRSKRDVLDLVTFHLVRSPTYVGRLLVYAPRRAWRAITARLPVWDELVEVRPDHPRDERGHLLICGEETED